VGLQRKHRALISPIHRHSASSRFRQARSDEMQRHAGAHPAAAIETHARRQRPGQFCGQPSATIHKKPEPVSGFFTPARNASSGGPSRDELASGAPHIPPFLGLSGLSVLRFYLFASRALARPPLVTMRVSRQGVGVSNCRVEATELMLGCAMVGGVVPCSGAKHRALSFLGAIIARCAACDLLPDFTFPFCRTALSSSDCPKNVTGAKRLAGR
jgi:hypothetical protein